MAEEMRDDHAELLRRRALTEDAARPDAVERRHAAGGRTARENIEDLVDAGSFVEYGRFAIAAQRFRRDVDDLIARTPADGLWLAPRDQRRRCSTSAAPARCCPTTTPCSPARRARSATARRTGCSTSSIGCGCPTVFFAEGGGGRPGRHRLSGRVVARRARVQAVGGAVRGWCRGSRSSRAAASRATP